MCLTYMAVLTQPYFFQDLFCRPGAAGAAHLPGSAATGRRSDTGFPQPGPQLRPALPHLSACRPGGGRRAPAARPGAGGSERRQPDGPPAGPHAVGAVVLSDPVPAVLHGTGHRFAGRSDHLPQPGGLWRLPPLDALRLAAANWMSWDTAS